MQVNISARPWNADEAMETRRHTRGSVFTNLASMADMLTFRGVC